MSENRPRMLSKHSLPRLFGKKKAKLGERVDHVVEGRARGDGNLTKEGQVNPTRGNQVVGTLTKSLVELPLSSASSNQSMATAYSEHSFNNENLYVNGQVPRGQFKEYFSVPALEHRLEHLPLWALPDTRRRSSCSPRPVDSVEGNIGEGRLP